MTTIQYVTVDVFTRDRFGGNPLAVIPDARGLDGELMQRIAAEFNCSESTFVLPPDDPANTAHVRIFTPTDEIPFAGHPNVGTAFVLAQAGVAFGQPLDDAMRFEERAGLVQVDVLRAAGTVTGASIRAPKSLELGSLVDVETVAACLSLAAGDIVVANHEPLIASVGLPFAFAEVASLTALARATPNVTAFGEADAVYPHADDHFALMIYTRLSTKPWRVRARMFAPLSNTFEDPATGSAAGALGALLASLLPDPGGEFTIELEQGIEMGRPSLIRVSVGKTAGMIGDVSIAGACVSVMRGTIELGVDRTHLPRSAVTVE